VLTGCGDSGDSAVEAVAGDLLEATSTGNGQAACEVLSPAGAVEWQAVRPVPHRLTYLIDRPPVVARLSDSNPPVHVIAPVSSACGQGLLHEAGPRGYAAERIEPRPGMRKTRRHT
jgi:hypothetical protein